MDMSAYFLASLCGSKHPDDRDLRLDLWLQGSNIPGQFRIKDCGLSLIVVNAVESDAEEIHCWWAADELIEQQYFKRILRRRRRASKELNVNESNRVVVFASMHERHVC